MIEEGKGLKDKEEKAIKTIKVPVKIINAGNSFLLDGGKRYFELANEPKEKVIIDGAGHTFDEDGAEEKLFSETISFIKRYT